MDANYFGNVQHIPGVGFLEAPGGKVGGSAPLHGEADVMMISGLGAEEGTATSQNGRVVSTTGTFSLSAALGQKVKVLGIELPLWAVILIAAGALGAGWIFFRKMSKK